MWDKVKIDVKDETDTEIWLKAQIPVWFNTFGCKGEIWGSSLDQGQINKLSGICLASTLSITFEEDLFNIYLLVQLI